VPRSRRSALVLTLNGLPRPRGDTARKRRLALASETDEQLGERLHKMTRSLRALDDEILGALAAAIDLPLGELVASPFALRMIALGARLGVRTVRHETRAMLPSRGVWERGVLVTGKYDAFRQDDPLVAHHPEHVAKWAPHEHLHRAVGFFDRPGATRFERYVGARLNEILPVSTWYGLEHALRLENDGARFDPVADGLAPSAALERARWRSEPADVLRVRCARAAPRLRWTIRHVARELEAVDAELAEGRVLRVVHEDEPHLDASSDAMAYAIAHEERLANEPVARVLAAYGGRSRFTQLAALRRSVEATLDVLLFDPIELDLRAIVRAQEHRRAWDVASRLAHAAPQHFSRITRTVAARGRIERLSPAIAKLPIGARVLQTGDVGRGAGDVGQLDRGLASAAPRTRAHVRRGLVARFARSPELLDRGTLPARLAHLLENDGAPTWLVDLAHLEGLVLAATRSDPRIEALLERGPLPARLDAAITTSAAFRLAEFSTDVLALHAGGAPENVVTRVLIGRVDGAVSLVSIDAATARAWSALSGRASRFSQWAAHVRDARGTLDALAAHGAVGWAR
jgi:hypothetical protein